MGYATMLCQEICCVYIRKCRGQMPGAVMQSDPGVNSCLSTGVTNAYSGKIDSCVRIMYCHYHRTGVTRAVVVLVPAHYRTTILPLVPGPNMRRNRADLYYAGVPGRSLFPVDQ